MYCSFQKRFKLLSKLTEIFRQEDAYVQPPLQKHKKYNAVLNKLQEKVIKSQKNIAANTINEVSETKNVRLTISWQFSTEKSIRFTATFREQHVNKFLDQHGI